MEISNELTNYLLLEDIKNGDITYPINIILAHSTSKIIHNSELNASIDEGIYIKSFLVPIERKEAVYGKCRHSDILSSGEPFFEEDGTYNLGEVFEWKDIPFEISVNDRFFSASKTGCFVPTDRMINYLGLYHQQDTWCDPYSEDIIIKKVGERKSYEPHEASLTVRKSELIDYLAARRCGLLILRYAERTLKISAVLDQLPRTTTNFQTKHGDMTIVIEENFGSNNETLYFSRLWDSFWIDPASKPRRWDASDRGEFVYDVKFTLADGEKGTFVNNNTQYFKVISFNPTLFNAILAKPKHAIKFHGLTNFSIIFPDHDSVLCCVNKEGQIQSFFGSIAKLDADKQQFLASYSESKKAELSPEYIRTTIEGKWGITYPFSETLSNCLKSINEPWIKKYQKSLLLSPNDSEISVKIRIGPSSKTMDELIDIMLEFQKIVIPEHGIDEIKQKIDCSTLAENIESYNKMKSIAYTTLLMKKVTNTEGHSLILKLINDLRNCKGHPNNLETILDKYKLSKKSPQEIHFHILSEFCIFLLDFRTINENILNVTYDPISRNVDDIWCQLRFAANYFKDPF